VRSLPLAVVVAALAVAPTAAPVLAAPAPVDAPPAGAGHTRPVALVDAGAHADAVVAGPTGGVVLYTAESGLPPATARFLAGRADSITSVRVLGGPAAVSENVLAEVLAALGR
jgi:hypothetical protein